MILNVALLQLESTEGDRDKALQKGIKACREAAKKNVDIILFPEIWTTGYQTYDPKVKGNYEKWLKRAITKDDNFVKSFQELAKELNTAIVITYLEKYKNAPRNVASLIDSHGKIVMTYAKVHTCDFDPHEVNMTAGDDFYVYDLSTTKGSVKIGIMICMDREFPESARILMLKGAEIILVPNSCKVATCELLGDVRIQQFRSRAFENMVGVAMANYAQPTCDGHSCAFNVNGKEIVMGNHEEDILIAEFDMERIRKFREHEIWGNAYRKPECYKDLTNTEVKEPFIRKSIK